MQTTILVSVLATLLVVTVASAVVVAFRKLNTKVDVESEKAYNYTDDVRKELIDLIDRSHSENREAIKDLQQNLDSLEVEIFRMIDERTNIFEEGIRETRSVLDSRCDKLYNNNKSLLEMIRPHDTA
jgi:peptidoglycan hydrolase CwlO-like protein